MSTKDYCLSLKDKQAIAVVDNNTLSNDQYSNLNLNHQNLSSSSTVQSSTNHKNDNKKETNYVSTDGLRTKSLLQQKQASSPNLLNNVQLDSDKKELKKESDSKNAKNSSTLSLHIAAYENSLESAVASDSTVDGEKRKSNAKQALTGAASLIPNPFELPRQQKEEANESIKPEIMQFKASQKLLNPNESIESTDMGHNKRKRKPVKPTAAAEEGPSTDAKRIKEDEETQLFLNELHQDAATLLSDLLADKKLVFVEGSVGCGKTTLVKRVANELNLPIVTLQLSDQIDAKTFIGSYQCTEVPGEFVWEPSVFSKAVTKRCLILLEDIDSATTELVSTLYLMNKSWNAPLHSDGSLTAFHPDARIVATVRAENNHSDSSELIRANPMTVILKPLSNEELRKIIEHKFPSLLSVAEKLLNIFFELSQMMLADSIIDRDLNANDLIRACRRLASLPSLNDNQQIFIELSDIYIVSISNIAKRSRLAAALGKHLSIPEQQVDMLLSKREPDVISNTNGAKFGRAKIPVRKGILVDTLSSKHFGFTSDAKRLMERIAVCIEQNGKEAILLTGETGVGKTSVVQMMALYSNNILDVVNLSQDSDSTDLIGGYKPIGTLELLTPLIENVDQLLKTSFDTVKNAKFCSHFTTLLNEERFSEYLMLTEATAKRAIENKCGDQLAWADILVRCQRLSKSLNSRKSALPFAYVEGIVSKAAKNGHWLLVDEINLASAECLDAIIHVFDGNLERHPDFRLFACMNPATDTGKKKLPVGIRTRFTEFFVHEPTDKDQLTVIVRNYLPTIEALHLGRLLNFYYEICQLFPRKYSLRNLCRALSFAGDNLYGNPYRSLFEGVSMSFGSDLDNDGMAKFDKILRKHFEGVPIGIARAPTDGKKILVEGSYIERGDNSPETDPHYVYTESIKKNLSRLSRAVASGRFPILLEGETSAGKTSMILDLALTTGNIVHRINNHEHTDIQEYIGCYAPDENGKLTFVEGVLLQAVRQGHWVILDELNLAPVEVLEALNRLLDDNRELFVAERNLVVKAHPRFRLFATQNPVGTYAGRKRLSRAFLNRFVVLRFDHPPFEELTQIVCARCGIANSPAVAMIKVLTELKRCRSNTGLFNASDGLMTLRDLFRWANRLAKSDSGEWRQVLADQGYFLLAARCRNVNDAAEVVRVLEQVLKVKIDTEKLFSLDSPYLPDVIGKQLSENIGHIVSTFGMRRMLVLSAEAWRCKEPILMVGETGCGKTTAAQLLSEGNLLSINCHERTETSDLLGTIRPKPDGSFFWQDGIVVQAMKNGSKLLIDEISLASDSVLERLNPLLESSRTVLLTDAGADAEVVVAHPDFQVIATMNPGTDHGKKELSKALRNRFTEIWCSCDHPIEDIKKIIAGRISMLSHEIGEGLVQVIDGIVEFFISFTEKFGNTFRTVFSIRDIIAAADLFLACKEIAEFSYHNAFVNSLTGVVVDSIGVLPARTTYNAAKLKKKCHQMILEIAKKNQIFPIYELESLPKDDSVSFGNFPIELGPLPIEAVKQYSFLTPTTEQNALRVARALLLEKPIMLEGSPGAGKSSLIVALAKATGHSLVRLNLSDQTDLSDLFGHDVPVSKPDGTISFQWQDGPILKAIKEGSWILLDEMNLASQSVLEGLNSCFDFRQELFIAELNKKFIINSDQCRFFACQNPQTQGGNRRALPKSFLNRFTSIYIEPFEAQDFSIILNQELPDSRLIVEKMIRFNREMQNIVKSECPGIEFEFNMRDLLRWASFIHEFHDISVGAEILYINRLPYSEIQQAAKRFFGQIFGADLLTPNSTVFYDENNGICFGQKKYNLPVKNMPALPLSNLLLLSSQTTLLQQLCICIKLNWIVLLNGPRLTGKASAIETLCQLSQSSLKRMRLNKETDASELLGSYEQVLDYKILEECFDEFCGILKSADVIGLPQEHAEKVLKEMETTEKTDVHHLRCKIIQIAALLKDEAQEKLNIIANKLSKVYLRFEWRSSVFVEAYKNGDWLLIEDVNCCSAAVLDRLNCCLESGGKLVLPEQIDGSIEEIEPHPSFRVFFTMDAKNGALSRAMKNRCVEFCIDEKSSWFGNADSALNIMLLKEPLMCATLEDEKLKNEMSMENLKKFLRTSARVNVSTEQRLAEFSDAFDLCPSIDELKTDKISFRALTAAESVQHRNPPLLLSSKRQLRLPFAEHPLFKHKNGIVPDVLHSELQIQDFYRIAMDFEDDSDVLPSEYELANLALAILASSSDCLLQNLIFYNTFNAIDERSKKELINIIVDILKRQRTPKSSTPWDLRVYENSTFDYVSDETIDKRLLKFLAIWLKHEAQLMKIRMGSESPFALSSAFQDGEIDSSKLQNHAYATLSFICTNLIAAAEQLDFSSSSGDELRDNLWKSFEFIFGLAAFMDISVTSQATVHPLLLIRQCLQDLGISFYATKDHPIWKQVYDSFKSNKRSCVEMDKFTNIIGTSSLAQTVEYIDSLNTVCAVRPLGDEMDYLSLKNLIPSVQEAYVTTKHRSQPTRFSLDSLVYGLQNLLKTFVFIKHKNIGENFALHFPEAALQHFEILDRFSHEKSSTKERLKFLTVLNSNVATYNINQSLKTAHVTSVEILLDVIIDFWKGFRFSTTSFAAIPLSALSSASDKISEYQSFIWIARNIIQKYSNLLSDQILTQTSNFMGEISDNLDFFNRCKDAFKMIIPAKGLVDPGLTDLVNLSVNQSRQRILELFAVCTKLFPAHASAHPILRYIHESVIKTAETIECLEQKQIKVYRTSHLKFDEFNTELRQFYSRWLSALDGYVVRQGPWYRDVSFSTVLGHSSRTNTLINLAQSFCDRLIFEYYDLPDVILPVYAILQCFLLTFHLQSYLCDRHLKLRRINTECNNMVDSSTFVYPSTDMFENEPSLRFLALEGRESVVPMQFQLEVAHSLLSSHCHNKDDWNDKADLALGWVLKEWELWFEKHKEKREQMFVYKSTGGGKPADGAEDDETMPDPEDLEIQALLPNFDDTDFEAASAASSSPAVQSRLPDAKDLCAIIDAVITSSGKASSNSDTLLSTVWFLDFFNHSDVLLNPNFDPNSSPSQFIEHSVLMDKHLLAISKFRQSLHSKPLKNVINVYTENDKAEVNRCVDAIHRLEARVNEIREEFPEEANLKEISEIITTFLNADCGVPQMKLASWVEKVLEKCEHWQKLAPRQYSLIDQLNELQQILVDWRKMQVHSWHHIINAVQEESQAIAVTMGYPIIQTLMQWRTNPTQEKNANNFLAMIVDWIQSSTLIDFESRLKIALFAAILSEIFAKSDTQFYELSSAIKSMVFYFSAYLQSVQEKLKNKRAEVVQELENFVNIVKFHDLNLWSVKNSAEKAHQKLFKIIKKYKLHGNEQLSTLFLSFLPEIPRPLAIQALKKSSEVAPAESRLNYANFYERFSKLLMSLPGLNEPESLFEYCSDYLGILKKDVIYAENDDEGNEKLQGQALFDRQRRFAALVKHASKFGLRSRRAAPISSEELLASSLTMDAKNTGLNEEYFRSCAVTRNLVIRLVNQLNATKQPHILKQVSVQMISHIRGITEYGFAWLLNSVPAFQRLEETIQWIRTTRDRLSVFVENAKRPDPCFTASPQSTKIFDEAKDCIQKSYEIGKLLQSLVAAAPDKSINSTYNSDVSILAELRDVALHKEHLKYHEIKTNIDDLVAILQKMTSLCDDYGKRPVEETWKVSDIESFLALLLQEATNALKITKDKDLQQHFTANLKNLILYLKDLHKLASSEKRFEAPMLGDVAYISSDLYQFKMQQTFKAVDSKIDETQASLDIFKKIAIACSAGIDFNQEITRLVVLMEQLSNGYSAPLPDLERYTKLTTEILETLELAQSALVQFTDWVAVFYIHFGHVSSQILQKGLVNAIPKKEEGEGGQGKDMEDVGGENAGMGEGQGAKDVSEQIEETGQVDDLMNEDEENGTNENQEPQERPKDSENPLEMEDDFAADLENLDNEENEKGENDQDNDEPDEEPNVDWDMGDVEEPEENQLDPNLWDKPEPEDKKLDDRPEGADKQTEEIAAKENDDTVANEDTGKEEEDKNDETKDEDEKKEDDFDLENVNQNDVIDNNDEEEVQPPQENELDSSEPIDEEDATDDEADAETEEQQPESGMEVDENQEDATEEEPEKEGEIAEDGVQSEEVEKNNQGQTASDEKTKQNSAGGENDDEKENAEEEEKDENLEAKEESTQGKNDARNARTKASLQKAQRPLEETSDDVEINEPESSRLHAQPTEEDDPMDIDGRNEEVDEAMDDDEIDEASKNLAHINDDKHDNRDQLVVQKSTVEEARSTRSQYERMKPNYDNDVVESGEQQEEDDEPQDATTKDKDFTLTSEEQKHHLIHISRDFFDLSQQAVKSLANIQPDIDSSEAYKNDARKYATLSDSVGLMASELAENLRQILEPSIANRLQGDYRTGKRLNMRRLVSYIASDYRKNRIWLRRTKKQQRNFQIMIAIDDSQSMGENRMGEITCQSVCLIEKAFRQLEVGQLAICKFGQSVQMLREFSSATDAQDTLIPSLLDNLRFDQNKTDLLGLLSYASKTFETAKENTPSSSVPVQMLVVIGDGHGAFAQGKDPLVSALKEMEHQNITVLYVIVDGKNSILKMNYTTFEGGKPKMTPYISVFPFSFYALVRSISTLPGTLAEAIRQWFEMAMQE